MTRRLNLAILLLPLLTLLAGISTSAHAPTVTVSKFKDVNAPGAMQTATFAVNDGGVFAGEYVDAFANKQHGMILNGQKLTTVDRPNCQNTPGPGAISLFGLNNSAGSQVTAVGWCFDTQLSTNVGFLYNNGQFTTIAFPNAAATMAQGVNDNGDVVGAFLDQSGLQHGFLFNGTQYTQLDVPNHFSADAWSINKKGVVAIFAKNSAGLYDSFLFIGNTYREVNVPRAGQSVIHGINKFGDRVYSICASTNATCDLSGQTQGVLFVNGRGFSAPFHDPKDGHSTRAFGLNDRLEITGYYMLRQSLPPQQHPPQGFSAIGCCHP